jgi:uncharacterized zinc-type alcohol dehydrogenase-like protein
MGGYSSSIVISEHSGETGPGRRHVDSLCGHHPYSQLKHDGFKDDDKADVLGTGGLSHMEIKFAKATERGNQPDHPFGEQA